MLRDALAIQSRQGRALYLPEVFAPPRQERRLDAVGRRSDSHRLAKPDPQTQPLRAPIANSRIVRTM